MELERRSHQARRGVAGIVAAAILFAMLFTVGTGYFLFVNQGNKVYGAALLDREQSQQNALSEVATISVHLVGDSLGVVVSNSGGIPINVTGSFVTDSTGKTAYVGGGSGSPLPMVVNPGSTSAVINMGVAYKNTLTYTIKVFTARGTVYTATFPLSTQQQAVQLSGVTQGLGSVFLKFSSFRFYSAQYDTYNDYPETVGDGWEVGGFYGFNFPGGLDSIFQGVFQNFDPLQRNITVNQNTLLYEAPPCTNNYNQYGQCYYGNQQQTTVVYYVVGDLYNIANCDQGSGYPPCVGANSYKPVTIPYGKSALLNFSASEPGGEVNPPDCYYYNNWYNQNQYCPPDSEYGAAPIFLEMFGVFSDHTPFGQTIPFVASYGSSATFSHGQTGYAYLSVTRGRSYELYLSSYNVAPKAYWTWTNGSLTDVTGTTNPSYVWFNVPSGATVGSYYSVMVSDGNSTTYAEVNVSG